MLTREAVQKVLDEKVAPRLAMDGGGIQLVDLTEDGVVAFGADGSMLRLVSDAGTREIPKSEWPEELRVTNVEAVGFNLLRDHPGAIEIAGVILLMAMLGAVVLSRKQVEMDEDAKRAMAAKLRRTLGGGES